MAGVETLQNSSTQAHHNKMFQIRIHGRGGQGVVSGAEMLSVAAFLEGRYAQAFPSFGSERMWRAGDGVLSHRRQGNSAARPVLEPDALIIQDATLLHQVDLFSGLPLRGHILLNSTKSFDELGSVDFARRPAISGVHAPCHRARAEACRPFGAERGAPRRVRRSPA